MEICQSGVDPHGIFSDKRLNLCKFEKKEIFQNISPLDATFGQQMCLY